MKGCLYILIFVFKFLSYKATKICELRKKQILLHYSLRVLKNTIYSSIIPASLVYIIQLVVQIHNRRYKYVCIMPWVNNLTFFICLYNIFRYMLIVNSYKIEIIYIFQGRSMGLIKNNTIR
jgi:hypothetical protein